MPPSRGKERLLVEVAQLPAAGAEWTVHLTGLGFCQVSKVEGRADEGVQGLDRDRL